MIIARFDLRAPGADAATRSALARTAVEMARRLDTHRGATLVVSEHHSSGDGYNSSPFTLAAAMAAVTERVPVVVASTILPFHEPVRLAEDIIALDHLSAGRSMVVLALGYRPEEYELFGVDHARRGAIADAKLDTLLGLLDDAAAERGEPRVTPAPFTRPRPVLAWGGGSVAAARRAGRTGLGFFAQTDAPGLREAYVAAAEAAGHEPGLCVLPSPDAPYATFVSDDVERSWNELGPALLADATTYHRWNVAAGIAEGTASLSSVAGLDDLRQGRSAHRVIGADEVAAHLADHGLLALHPLCGGIDPEVAWRHLETALAAVDAARAGAR